MMKNTDKIQEIIDDLIINKIPQNKTNVISISVVKDTFYLPEVIKIINEGSDQVIYNLTEAKRLIIESRKKVLDKAREYCSFSEHDQVYHDLNEIHSDEEDLKIQSYNWAQAVIALMELQEAIE
jgi:hypothetical protein